MLYPPIGGNQARVKSGVLYPPIGGNQARAIHGVLHPPICGKQACTMHGVGKSCIWGGGGMLCFTCNQGY